MTGFINDQVLVTKHDSNKSECQPTCGTLSPKIKMIEYLFRKDYNENLFTPFFKLFIIGVAI